MWKNYLTVALRNLRKQKVYVFINVTGLAVGMACCLLILLYVQEERSFDTFHPETDRLYRLNKVVTLQDAPAERHAITSGLMGPTLVEEYPEVEQAVRVLPWFDDMLMTRGEMNLKVPQVLFADVNFFQVFGLRLLRGDPATALSAPLSIVLTEETARRFFGEEDPMGKTLTALEGFEYTVTGVAANPPSNTHLPFNALISWASTVPEGGGLDYLWMNNWLTQVHYTYLLLASSADPEALEAKFPDFMARNFAERADQYHLYLQPFSEIYLHSSDLLHTRGLRLGNSTYVYLFSVVALLVLLIACVNFTNLSTARATKRAQEVGVRKAVGAQRHQIVWQFLSESVLLSLVALMLAVALLELALPAFNEVAGKALQFDPLSNPLLLGGLAGVMLVVGLMGGLYPALVLSRFRPMEVLKRGWKGTPQGAMPRKVLVVAQFAISIVLVVGTLVVYRQMQFVQEKNLGFRKEQIVVLPIGDTDLAGQFEAFKSEVQQHPSITHVTGSNTVPGGGTMGFTIYPEGKPEDELWMVQSIRLTDHDFLETYDMELVTGRDFSEEYATDTSAVLINEALARALGWEEPVGKQLDIEGEVENGRVIGVVEDFHYESLHHAIDPLIFFITPRHGMLSVRFSGEDVSGVLAFLREKWEAFEAQHPFEYSFLDESFGQFYEAEQRLMQTLGFFALLAILIACLGLFGLAAFTAEQRTKEIGIRKVLGASIPGIIGLLSKDFARLVLVAFAVGAPVAYWAMQRWLEDFAYRTELPWWLFLLAGLSALAIALLTTSYHAVKAALMDPVKALRYE